MRDCRRNEWPRVPHRHGTGYDSANIKEGSHLLASLKEDIQSMWLSEQKLATKTHECYNPIYRKLYFAEKRENAPTGRGLPKC